LIGALIGDAAGGPVEFQPAQRGPWTATDAVLSAEGRAALAAAFRLRPYTTDAAPYAQWEDQAPPGTVTDDSRFKVLFFEALARAEGTLPDRATFAQVVLDAHADTTGPHAALRRAWLDEFAYAARWVLGERDEGARPPARAWGGIPTMAGQMPFLPIAALHPGDPEAAYRAVWALDFLDNGIARDLNAALVAGLAAALDDGATWARIEAAMRATDPFGFGEVPWVPRRLDGWLDVAHAAVAEAEGRPARLYAALERDLQAETWWDAWVPMVVVFACVELAQHDPLAAMQLVLEFGYDTDSYLQVVGAFVGALHGPEVFPAPMRATVEAHLERAHGVTLAEWLTLLRR
ncbi:MAG: ADP-ribosylglycohydrolase family protein, partial [Bacteroidota bacterium]